jgi:hypothetical protein
MSEIILYNNSKKLKENPELFNDTKFEELERYRDFAVELERNKLKNLDKNIDKYQIQIDLNKYRNFQEIKAFIKEKIKELSKETYVYRDENIFGTMISIMADKILTKPQFSNYTFKEDMKGLGIEYVLRYIYRFDPDKTSDRTNKPVSSFAFISTILFSGILQTINKFKKDQEKLKKEIEERRSYQKKTDEEINKSRVYDKDYENIDFKEIKIELKDLYKHTSDNKLYRDMKFYTIKEPTCFLITSSYKITEKDYDYIIKYKYAISIKRY